MHIVVEGVAIVVPWSSEKLPRWAGTLPTGPAPGPSPPQKRFPTLHSKDQVRPLFIHLGLLLTSTFTHNALNQCTGGRVLKPSNHVYG